MTFSNKQADSNSCSKDNTQKDKQWQKSVENLSKLVMQYTFNMWFFVLDDKKSARRVKNVVLAIPAGKLVHCYSTHFRHFLKHPV